MTSRYMRFYLEPQVDITRKEPFYNMNYLKYTTTKKNVKS